MVPTNFVEEPDVPSVAEAALYSSTAAATAGAKRGAREAPILKVYRDLHLLLYSAVKPGDHAYTNPLAWYAVKRNFALLLHDVVTEMLSAPATSVGAESSFSYARSFLH